MLVPSGVVFQFRSIGCPKWKGLIGLLTSASERRRKEAHLLDNQVLAVNEAAISGVVRTVEKLREIECSTNRTHEVSTYWVTKRNMIASNPLAAAFLKMKDRARPS